MLNKILLLIFFFVFNHINCLASDNDVFISRLNIDDPNIKTKFIIMENTDFAFAPPLFIKEKKQHYSRLHISIPMFIGLFQQKKIMNSIAIRMLYILVWLYH